MRINWQTQKQLFSFRLKTTSFFAFQNSSLDSWYDNLNLWTNTCSTVPQRAPRTLKVIERHRTLIKPQRRFQIDLMRLVLRRCHVRFDVWQWHVTESPDLQQAWGGDIYIAGQANTFWARRNLLKASHKHLLGSEPNGVLLLVKKQPVSLREAGLHMILVFTRFMIRGSLSKCSDNESLTLTKGWRFEINRRHCVTTC